jgi:hypothetical protein
MGFPRAVVAGYFPGYAVELKSANFRYGEAGDDGLYGREGAADFRIAINVLSLNAGDFVL